MNSNKNKPEAFFDKNLIPISITKVTLDIFQKQGKEYEHLIALYMAYFSTAIWQNTSTVYATVDYIAKVITWERKKVIKYRKRLKELGFIEDVTRIEKHGMKYYVKVNFLWETPKGGGYAEKRNRGVCRKTAYKCL